MKKNDVQRIEGKPTYASVKPILDTVEMNLINMDDQQDSVWGKLHIIQITNLLANGPAILVVPSTNQDEQIPWIVPVTPRQRETHLIGYFRQQNNWLDNQAAQEALK